MAVDSQNGVDAPRRSRGTRGKGRRVNGNGRQEIGRYDQALRNAKNEAKLVQFVLAVEATHTDEDCSIVGQVLEVDKFDVAVIPVGEQDRTVWIKKSAIVTTEVLT